MSVFVPAQIMTAPHWYATFSESDHEAERIPLVCWSVGRYVGDHDEDGNSIQGMILDDNGDVVPARDQKNFAGYELDIPEYDIDMEMLN